MTSSTLNRLESILVPLGAIASGLLVFGVFCAALGVNPLLVYASIFRAGFGSWYSWQNTLVRASPLRLTGLCTALPARAGIIVIGNEGAVVTGGLGAIAVGLATQSLPPWLSLASMLVAAMVSGGIWIAASAALPPARPCSITVASVP